MGRSLLFEIYQFLMVQSEFDVQAGRRGGCCAGFAGSRGLAWDLLYSFTEGADEHEYRLSE